MRNDPKGTQDVTGMYRFKNSFISKHKIFSQIGFPELRFEETENADIIKYDPSTFMRISRLVEL